MSKPTAKLNLVHQQVLAGLTATRPTAWDHKVIVPATSTEKEKVDKVKVVGTEVRYPLAQNVSEENIERAAVRWARAVA